MNKKTAIYPTEEGLLVDLTFNKVPASLLSEFAEKIVRPYYQGNMNAAIQDLFHKAIEEQDFVFTQITAYPKPKLNLTAILDSQIFS
jgi:hypothetical protein